MPATGLAQRLAVEAQHIQDNPYPRIVTHEETIIDARHPDGSIDRVLVDVSPPVVTARDDSAPDGRPVYSGNQLIRAEGRSVSGELVNPETPPRAAAIKYPKGEVETALFTTDLDTGRKTVERYREPAEPGETRLEHLTRVSQESITPRQRHSGGSVPPTPGSMDSLASQVRQFGAKAIRSETGANNGNRTESAGKRLLDAGRQAMQTAQGKKGKKGRRAGPRKRNPDLKKFQGESLKNRKIVISL